MQHVHSHGSVDTEYLFISRVANCIHKRLIHVIEMQSDLLLQHSICSSSRVFSDGDLSKQPVGTTLQSAVV